MATINQCYNSDFVDKDPGELLDFDNYDVLPSSHIWNPPEDPHTYPVVDEPITIINLDDPEDTLIPQITCVCKSMGAFGLLGHGLPMDLLDQVESECHRLFSLPREQKFKARRSPSKLSGYGSFVISRCFSKAMWSESFTMAGPMVEDVKALWPDDYHKFCEVFGAYRHELKKVAVKLTNVILASLGLSEEDVGWPGFDDANPVIQANWYPPCPDPTRAMGLAPHTDSSLVTLIFQSNVSGYQLLLPADEQSSKRWVTVPAMPGMLVVNLGDLFKILSNGKYSSALHRVISSDQGRYSVSFFLGPPTQAKISPLKKLVHEGECPVYREVTWSEFVALKLKYLDKSLEKIELAKEPLSPTP